MVTTLVAYFSASGVTKKVGDRLAVGIGADIFEINPEVPYSEADLRWTNPLARCNREKIGRKDVPIAKRVKNMEKYDTLFLGFPIWYYGAPNIIMTFLKSYDLSGKRKYRINDHMDLYIVDMYLQYDTVTGKAADESALDIEGYILER